MQWTSCSLAPHIANGCGEPQQKIQIQYPKSDSGVKRLGCLEILGPSLLPSQLQPQAAREERCHTMAGHLQCNGQTTHTIYITWKVTWWGLASGDKLIQGYMDKLSFTAPGVGFVHPCGRPPKDRETNENTWSSFETRSLLILSALHPLSYLWWHHTALWNTMCTTFIRIDVPPIDLCRKVLARLTWRL